VRKITVLSGYSATRSVKEVSDESAIKALFLPLPTDRRLDLHPVLGASGNVHRERPLRQILVGQAEFHRIPYIITAMWRSGKYEKFRCPLCGSPGYMEVRVRKSNGNWYTTEFFQCAHCTVMFRDPVLFTRHKSGSPNERYSPGGAHNMTAPLKRI